MLISSRLGLVENESSIVCCREVITVLHEDFPEVAHGFWPCEYGEAKVHLGGVPQTCVCCWKMALCAYSVIGYAITIPNTHNRA